MHRFIVFSGENLQDQVNEWLANNTTIEVVSTNVITGHDSRYFSGGWPDGYMILYKEYDTSKLV